MRSGTSASREIEHRQPRDTAHMTRDENAEIGRAVVDAFNRRDVKALEALLAQDAEIVPIRAAVEGTVYRGPNVAGRWFSEVDASWEDLTVTVDEVRATADGGLLLGRVRGRGRGSGATIDVEAAAVARLRNGLITHLRIYTDRAKALEDAGLAE
jgi:ketosteroid isomerase-like protein